jgi:hypothetical protein
MEEVNNIPLQPEKRSYKKWVFIILIVLIIAAIIIISSFFIFGETKEYRQCKKEADVKAIDPDYNTITSSSHRKYMEDCLMKLAIQKNDIDICEQTNNVLECEGRVSKDIEFCKNKYSGDEPENLFKKWYCIQGIAKETVDSQYCLSIDNVNQQARCIRTVAEETENYNICLEIKKLALENPGEDVDSCLIGLMYDEHYDSQMCYHVTDVNKSDDCFEYVGKRLKDPKLCNEIVQNNFNSKWSCLNDVGKSLASIEVCKMIPEEGEAKAYSSLCFRDVAVAKKDVNICYMMENSSENEIPFCITNVATETKNKEICNQITDKRWPDKTICALFGDIGSTCLNGKEMRERCVRDVDRILNRG